MERKEKTSNYDEVHAFATELYNFIWMKHQFCNVSLEKSFAKQLSLKFIETEAAKSSVFSEDIGNAVFCSQYLLREQCLDLFRFFREHLIMSKSSFIYCFNLIYHICAEFRSNVFEKLIDASAILAEAFLFCDTQTKPVIYLEEVPDVLVGFFETHVSKSFFDKGGWRQLLIEARKYTRTYKFLINYINRCHVPYVILYYDCKLINFLRDSPVAFPVHESWFCETCKNESDQPFEILDPKCTIEDLISLYSLQKPPWIKSTDPNHTLDELSSSNKDPNPVLVGRYYIFLGKSPKCLEEKEKEKTSKKKRQRKKTSKAQSGASK